MEDKLDAEIFVAPVELGVPVVVADQGSAADAIDREDAEVVSGTVVG